MTVISMDSFPAVIEDAILAAPSLEFRYVWIDALCTVQDDDKDWAYEAAIMDAVLSNAELTISTLVSSVCHTRLFQPRSAQVVHPVFFFFLDIWKHKFGRWSSTIEAVFPAWLEEDLKAPAPINSRGWTLQEQLLSTRILYFGTGMLHWEYLHGYVVEVDPGGNSPRRYDLKREIEQYTKRAIKGAPPPKWSYATYSPLSYGKCKLRNSQNEASQNLLTDSPLSMRFPKE
ncbi:hypothetical protein Focb16_v008302 [Fusarium oxysporum f. sp. cubense]|uniref:Heterokaryon incompatibility domain-containing protein n=1 Tax=Fusarium oxysporum f. sp. cubense TaxID=61366 RepID=A0A559LTH1_FUSOC|nr:hypothetical protein Focb16_v008302 [Fusarium oxysporum f. sp. cubense]